MKSKVEVLGGVKKSHIDYRYKISNEKLLGTPAIKNVDDNDKLENEKDVNIENVDNTIKTEDVNNYDKGKIVDLEKESFDIVNNSDSLEEEIECLELDEDKDVSKEDKDVDIVKKEKIRKEKEIKKEKIRKEKEIKKEKIKKEKNVKKENSKNNGVLIILIIVLLLGVSAGAYFLTRSNFGTNSGNTVSYQSSGWPDAINDNSNIANLSQLFLISIYGNNGSIDASHVKASKVSDDYLQVQYDDNVYLGKYFVDQYEIYKNYILEQNVYLHFENSNQVSPSSMVLEKTNIIMKNISQLLEGFLIEDSYTAQMFNSPEYNNVYLVRDDGYSNLIIGLYDNNGNQKQISMMFFNDELVGMEIR